jgi:hypothetical protein
MLASNATLLDAPFLASSDLYLVAGNDQERSIGVLCPGTGDAIVE